jgi:hypothetical protein
MNIVANAFKMMFALNGFVRTKLADNFGNWQINVVFYMQGQCPNAPPFSSKPTRASKIVILACAPANFTIMSPLSVSHSWIF